MTQTLLKIAMLGLLIVFLGQYLDNAPDAAALPREVEYGLNWLFSKFYFINEIFPVPTFFTVIYYAINGFIAYISLLILRTVITWVIGASN